MLYIFPIALALIILTIEILSIFHSISPGGIYLLNTISFIGAIALAVRSNRGGNPEAAGAQNFLGKIFNRCNFKDAVKNKVRRIFNSLKLDRGLIILCTGVIFLICVSFILAAFLPVNDYDALDYHTYRALVWADKAHIFHFDTKDIRSLVMPINSELIYTWIYSLTGKDTGFSLVEFISYIFGVIGIFTFFERLKTPYRKRLWAIFIFSSFAGIISQISSTQSDLLTGVLMLYSIIFFLDYINEKGTLKGLFSSLCFAIALGVKSTAFMAGLPILFTFLILSYKKKCMKKFLHFTGMLFINFVIFSSYNYILNFIDYSNPLGSEISINRHGFFGGIKGFIANFIRYNIQLLDFAGFMWGFYLSDTILAVQNSIFSILHITPETGVLMKMEGLNSSVAEQSIGFGVTGFLVFVPACITGIVLFIKETMKGFLNKKTKDEAGGGGAFDKKNAERRAERRKILYFLGLLFYINLAVLSFAIGYMVYSIRFIAAFAVISAPVIALTYFKKNNIYKTIVILFALYYLFLVSTHLAARPFYRLKNAYKSESYDKFIYNTRCMNYPFFKGERPGCIVDEEILGRIEKYKNVGIFSDEHILMHLTRVNAKRKHISVEELIIPRLDSYDTAKFDYLVTPYPSQPVDEFNNRDKKRYKNGEYPKNCYFRENENVKKVVKIECGIPFNKLEERGFAPVYNIRIGWKNVEDKQVYSQYIIWKNLKNLL